MQEKIRKKFKHLNLLLIAREEKKHCGFIKDFNTFIYDILHRGMKHFCRCCFQAFRTAVALKCHIKNSFEINCKQRIKIPTER